MKITDVITYVDRIKPNAFTDDDKARWISEVEGLVATEVFLLDPGEIKPYVISASFTAEGMCFPEENLIRLTDPIPEEFYAGGLLAITGGQIYAANSGSTKYRIKRISADGCEIRIDGTFTATGRDPDTAPWTLLFDGSEAELIVKSPHDKIYAAYLIAMIDFANGEYNKYQNTFAMFNNFWGEYCRWFARLYRPADRDPNISLAYISAYAAAVKHGYRGSEIEWLRSLCGSSGSSGMWISDGLEDGLDDSRVLWIIRDPGETEEIPIPDGLSYTEAGIQLMEETEPVGLPAQIPVGPPAVTEEDDGEILMVVDGAWSKARIEEWNGGSY